jgi:hypothetical protein
LHALEAAAVGVVESKAVPVATTTKAKKQQHEGVMA